LQARIEMPGDRPAAERTAVVDRLVGEIARIPGVRSVSAQATGFIAGFGGQDVRIRAEGLDSVPAAVSPRFYFPLTPAYFHTMRLPVVPGRAFTSRDVASAVPTVIVGRRLASLWPGNEAIGHRIRLGASDTLPWRTIVGVVGDAGDTTLRSTAS